MADWKLRYVIDADNKRAKTAFTEVDRMIDKVGDKARRGGSSMGGGMADVFGGNLAAQAVSNLTSKLYEGGRAVFDYTAKLEQTKVAFNTLMGGAANAAKHIEELQKLSRSTPLEFHAISRMSQRLQGAGIEAAKIVKLIEDIGNIAAATGDLSAERMEGIGVALSQIASKGKVSAEEMEQLAERGVPAWRILSEAIGKTAGETRKMAEDGKISADQLMAAFQRFSQVNFAGAMEKQAATFTGSMQVISNIALQTAQTAFQPIYDEISRFSTRVSDSLKRQEAHSKLTGRSFGFSIGEAIGIGLGEALVGNDPIKAYLESQRGLYQMLIDFIASPWEGMVAGMRYGRGASSAELNGRTITWDPVTNTMVYPGGGGAAQTEIPPFAPAAPSTGGGKGGARTKAAVKLPAFGSMRSLVISSGNPQWDAWFAEMGQKFGVDPNVLLLQAGKESSYNAGAVSPKGAKGFSQFMPDTAKRFGVDTSNIKDSIRGQAQYMAELLSMFGGDYRKALAGYNAGEGNVQKYKGIPPFRETRDYVSKIQSQYRSRVRDKSGAFGTYDAAAYAEETARAEMEEAQRVLDDWVRSLQEASNERLRIRRVESDHALEILRGQLDREELTEIEYIDRIGELRVNMLLDEQRELQGQIPTRETIQRLLELSLEIQTARLQRENDIAAAVRKQNEEYQKQIEALRKANQRPGTMKTRTGPGEGTGFLDQIYNATGGIKSMDDVMQQLGNTATDVFMQMGAGLGSMIESWTMLGSQADISVRRMTAAVLAGVASQAATLAIFHLAMGIAALTPWGAAMYGPAPLHFKAAAVWGAVAVGSALAGRAVAGDSMKSGGKGSGSGSSEPSFGANINRNPDPYSRASANVFQSGQDRAIERLSGSIDRLEGKIAAMSPGDVLTAGAKQRHGFISDQTIREFKGNASKGVELQRITGNRRG